MKFLLPLLLSLFFATAIQAQPTLQEKYSQAEILLNSGQTKEAYDILKEILPQIPEADTLRRFVVWNFTNAVSKLESQFRMKEDFTQSLQYGTEALELIRKYKDLMGDSFAEREAWMVKNIIVSYNGLSKTEEARKYKNLLYEGYRSNSLPKGISSYFNFDFFVLDNKNIWGYEWFEELPKDRFSKSFTKIVYYVYSRKADGTDDEQLYRLHVLMFHKIEEKAPDYVLTLKRTVGGSESSRTLYDYFYTADIDYVKLKNDIKEVVKKVKLPEASKPAGE